MITLYHVRNTTTGLGYIGQTVKSIAKRWGQHKRAGSGSVYLRHAIQARGADAFVVTVLCYVDTREQANALERNLISSFGTLVPHGYNLCAGGNVSDGCHPESTERMRAKLTGRKLSPESIAKRTATRAITAPAKLKVSMTPEQLAEHRRQARLAEWRDPAIRAKREAALTQARERRKAA